MSAALVAVALLSMSAVPDGARALGFSQADWERLAKGEVVNHVETERRPSSTLAHSESGVLIHKPLAACFAVVERYEDLSSFLPGMAESHVIERTAEGFRAHAATKVLWMKYGYGLKFQVDRTAGEIRWVLDPTQPKDIADTRGAWRFAAIDDGTTVLRYEMHADSGSALPQSIQNYATERTLPQILLAFRDHLQGTK